MFQEFNLLFISRILIAVALIIASIEVISLRKQFLIGGLFNLEVSRAFRKIYLPKVYHPLINAATNSKFFFATNLTRAVCGFALLYPWNNSLIVSSILVVSFLSVLLFHLAVVLGKDGADQMTLCVLLGLMISYIGISNNNTTLVYIGVITVSAQSCLSYLTAGIAKLFGNLWLRGNALASILSTRSFGQQSANNLMQRNNFFSKFSNYFVIAVELLFPIALFSPITISLSILGLCALLHISIAFSMGLNRFFWAFLASYPCIIYFNLCIFYKS